MGPEVSQALASFAASMNLGREARRELVTQFSSVENAGDLPGWITESTEDGEALRAAGGHDITPGNDQLHLYWTRGEGLAKWVGSPTPWTTLYHHLVKHMKNPEMAKRAASKWFEEVMGYASGSDLNRVAHGHLPRGDRIGPG